jgi:hypothetical protein
MYLRIRLIEFIYTFIRILERYIKVILMNSGCKNNGENQNIPGSICDNAILFGCSPSVKQGI